MKIEYILTILNLPGIGNVSARKILESINKNELNKSDFRDVILLHKIANKKRKLTQADYDAAFDLANCIIESCERHSVDFLNLMDDDYPESLKELSDAPLVLYLKGNRKLITHKESVAIVGTRTPTPHAIQKGTEIASKAAKSGMNVISGLALGSDTLAHRSVVAVEGYTTAVLAHGLDSIYPKQNKELASQIVDSSGLLISEYPPETPMIPYQLAERDRIQSGLANGLIVIETGINGGTQHAIKHTLKLGRPIACIYSHTDKEKALDVVQGNKELVEENKAKPLINHTDTDEFLESIRKPLAKVSSESQAEFNL